MGLLGPVRRLVDRRPVHDDLRGMTTSDECLARLETLVLGGDQTSLTMAETIIDDFVQSSGMSPGDTAHSLGEIQAEFARRIEPSPLRADILDAIGNHVLTVLESSYEGGGS